MELVLTSSMRPDFCGLKRKISPWKHNFMDSKFKDMECANIEVVIRFGCRERHDLVFVRFLRGWDVFDWNRSKRDQGAQSIE